MIIYSRHARRRMRLYDIDEADVEFVLFAPAVLKSLSGERAAMQEEKPHSPRKYVLKVVFVLYLRPIKGRLSKDRSGPLHQQGNNVAEIRNGPNSFGRFPGKLGSELRSGGCCSCHRRHAASVVYRYVLQHVSREYRACNITENTSRSR